MEKPGKSTTKTQIQIVEPEKSRYCTDYLVTEEPLEIRLVSPSQTLAVTMRTPGHDFDLAAGFLYSEGIIHHRQDLEKIRYCVDAELGQEQRLNILNITLKSSSNLNFKQLQRHFFMNSSCGVCGKASIDSLKLRGCSPVMSNLQVKPEIIYHLPQKLFEAQSLFSSTGGLHAAALFDEQGKLIKLREDVGRHNALDKLIGSTFLADELPLNQSIVMVSGRSSFEILQKCIMAKVPIICAISAPSSLAVELAREFGVTLIGFVRGERFNIYSGWERIIPNSHYR